MASGVLDDTVALTEAIIGLAGAVNAVAGVIRRVRHGRQLAEADQESSEEVRSPNGILTWIAASVVLMLVGGGLAVHRYWPDSSSTSPEAGGPSPVASSACEQAVTLTTPAEHQAITGAAGAQLSGSACGLGDRTVWAFSFAASDKTSGQYVDQGGGKPIVTKDGAWSFLDAPVGTRGDHGTVYTLTLVLASPACSGQLAQIPVVKDVRSISSLPAGCEVAATRDITVTY